MFPRYSTSLYVVVFYTVIHVVTAKDFLKAQSELRLKSFDKTINTNVIKFLFLKPKAPLSQQNKIHFN